MTNISAFIHNGITVELNQDFINLTKLWEMVGSPADQRPSDWSNLPSTVRLISQILAEKGLYLTEQTKKTVLVSKRGKGGKTLAIPVLACEYQRYLENSQKSRVFRIAEKEIQAKLAKQVKGRVEVETPVGYIDILSEVQIIEVKQIKDWKCALGQILVYGSYFPQHQKRIHLFDTEITKDENMNKLRLIQRHCNAHNVIVTW